MQGIEILESEYILYNWRGSDIFFNYVYRVIEFICKKKRIESIFLICIIITMIIITNKLLKFFDA